MITPYFSNKILAYYATYTYTQQKIILHFKFKYYTDIYLNIRLYTLKIILQNNYSYNRSINYYRLDIHSTTAALQFFASL